MKRAVVFGGSGFLGSHVADALTEAGFEVTIYDIRNSPYLGDSQKMIVGDVLDERKVDETVKGCDVVYNFSGISDIDEAASKPLESVKYNILGNTIILEACVKSGIERVVYASSLYVYSKAGSFYRTTKQACESLIEDYGERFGLPYTILRYGSLYGPRSDNRNFVHKILMQALREGKIVREGDGEEIREYIHVFDAAKGSVEILSDEFANQYVMITGNQRMKVNEVLSMIREMLDNKTKIEYVPASAGGVHYSITPYCFTPRLAKRLVSRTYVDLGQGILDCIHDMHKSKCDDPGYDEFYNKVE